MSKGLPGCNFPALCHSYRSHCAIISCGSCSKSSSTFHYLLSTEYQTAAKHRVVFNSRSSASYFLQEFIETKFWGIFFLPFLFEI